MGERCNGLDSPRRSGCAYDSRGLPATVVLEASDLTKDIERFVYVLLSRQR